VQNLLEILSVILLSSVKFSIGGVPLAVVGYNFPFIKAVATTSVGGILGVVIFLYLSEKILKAWYHFFPHKHPSHPQRSKKKIFTRRNRIIVSIKRSYGLLGISILTPLALSIPVGVFLAVRYFKDKQKILVYMITSVFLWSLLLSSIDFIF
jgi:hypothetical protein